MPHAIPSSSLSTRGILLLLLLVAAILPAVALPKFLRAKQSVQWPQATGTITVSRLVQTTYHQRKTFRGEIRYTYEVAGAEYSSTRVSFRRVNAGARDGWQQLIAVYPAGKSVPVFYNPKDPSFSVLEPGLSGGTKLLYQADIFFLAVFAVVFLILLHKFREPALR